MMGSECDVCGQSAEQFAAVEDGEQICILCLVKEVKKSRGEISSRDRRIEYLEGFLSKDPKEPGEESMMCQCGHHQHDGKCPIGQTDSSTGYKTVYCDCKESQPF